MTSSTDHIIASLAEGMQPVKPAHPARMFAGWIGLSLLYMVVLLCFGHLRVDLAQHLRGAYLVEVVLLAALIITCGMSAVALSFPDLHQKNLVVALPALPLLGFIGFMAYQFANEPPSLPKPPHGIECLLCICLYTLLPAVAMMLGLRRLATVRPAAAGCLALLAASSIGCLALRLSEDTDSIRHLVTWHYLPMAGFALAGVVIGRRLLKW